MERKLINATMFIVREHNDNPSLIVIEIIDPVTNTVKESFATQRSWLGHSVETLHGDFATDWTTTITDD